MVVVGQSAGLTSRGAIKLARRPPAFRKGGKQILHFSFTSLPVFPSIVATMCSVDCLCSVWLSYGEMVKEYGRGLRVGSWVNTGGNWSIYSFQG